MVALPLLLAALQGDGLEEMGPPHLPPPDRCALALRIRETARLEPEVLDQIDPLFTEPLLEQLVQASTPPERIALLEALAFAGNWRQDTNPRPFLFAEDPAEADAATFALLEIGGPRAASALCHLLSSDARPGQVLIAIAGLRDLGMPTSFPDLTTLAEDPSKDPVLRAEAALALPDVDDKQTRKWVKRLRLPLDTSAYFVASLNRLFLDLWPNGDARSFQPTR